jgi:hypothetical protein
MVSRYHHCMANSTNNSLIPSSSRRRKNYLLNCLKILFPLCIYIRDFEPNTGVFFPLFIDNGSKLRGEEMQVLPCGDVLQRPRQQPAVPGIREGLPTRVQMQI